MGIEAGPSDSAGAAAFLSGETQAGPVDGAFTIDEQGELIRLRHSIKHTSSGRDLQAKVVLS